MKSMTGFGSGSSPLPGGGRVSVEVRSVNHRFLDLRISAPPEHGPFEAWLRAEVGAAVGRGRVEVRVLRDTGPGHVEVDLERAEEWIRAWRRLARAEGLAEMPESGFLERRGDVFHKVEPVIEKKAEERAVRAALAAALAAHGKARAREGRALAREIRSRIRNLRALSRTMDRRAKSCLPETRKRLVDRVRDAVGDAVDEDRLLQEAVLLADRSDVTEELVRLRSHLDGLEEMLRPKEPVGREFEFLLQEVHREVNTATSKSFDLALTRAAVAAKSEIEKLREQIQNVE